MGIPWINYITANPKCNICNGFHSNMSLCDVSKLLVMTQSESTDGLNGNIDTKHGDDGVTINNNAEFKTFSNKNNKFKKESKLTRCIIGNENVMLSLKCNVNSYFEPIGLNTAEKYYQKLCHSLYGLKTIIGSYCSNI